MIGDKIPKRLDPYRHLPDYSRPAVTTGAQTRSMDERRTDSPYVSSNDADQLSRAKTGFRPLAGAGTLTFLAGDVAALPPEHPVRAAKGDLPQSWGPAPRATEAGGKPFK